MADHTRLVHPSAEKSISLHIEPGARLELACEQSEATIVREGRNLVFAFQDNAQIILDGFYDHFAHTASRPPVFIVEGMELPGERGGGGGVPPQGVGCIDSLGKFILWNWARRRGTTEDSSGVDSLIAEAIFFKK